MHTICWIPISKKCYLSTEPLLRPGRGGTWGSPRPSYLSVNSRRAPGKHGEEPLHEGPPSTLSTLEAMETPYQPYQPSEQWRPPINPINPRYELMG